MSNTEKVFKRTRRSEQNDFWRKVSNRTYENQLVKFSFNNIEGIGSGTLSFSKGITALCGSNGVGKTTILGAIATTLGVKHPSIHQSKFKDAQLSLDAIIENSSRSIPSAYTIEPDNTKYIDPAADLERARNYFSEIENLDEWLQQIDPIDLEKREVESISQIVGKEYNSVQIFEIEFNDKDDIIPYFRVTNKTSQYDSMSMGRGELSIHLLYWNLRQIRGKLFLLLEEPEVHISPQAQKATIDLVARATAEFGLCTVLTTHSHSILHSIPNDNIVLLSNIDNAIRMIATPRSGDLETILGISKPKACLILVEDACARETIKALVRNLDAYLYLALDFRELNGKDNVINALQHSQTISGHPAILGVLDGDERKNVNTTYPNKHAFLPTDLCPEAMLRKATETNNEHLATCLCVKEDRLHFLLSSLGGNEDHDWLIDLSKHIERPYEQILDGLVRHWLSIESNLDEAKALIAEIRRLIGFERP